MSNDQPARRPPAKSSGGGAPMGSTISIVIAVVAVVVGFLILRNINDDGGGGGATSVIETPGSTGGAGSTPEDGDDTTTSSTLPPTTTAPPYVFNGATVVVANASGVPMAAGTMTDALKSFGFVTGTATNAVGVEQRLDVSKVYYLPGGEQVAASVARAMGGIQVVAMPSTVPVESEAAGLGDATVLLMLGKDYGGQALPALSADGSALPTTPIDTTTTTTIAG